jgi:glycerol-3-phosphate dehydrogenase
MYWYGSDRKEMERMQKEEPGMEEVLSEELQISPVQVLYAVRKEMARTVEDFLARRTRALQLNAKESIRMAPAVAAIMAKEFGADKKWEQQQVAQFTALAQNYIIVD